MNVKMKKYPCPKCLSTFVKRHDLNRHLKYECGQAPRFQCPYCSYRAKQRQNAYSHVRKVHKKSEVYTIDIIDNSMYKILRTHFFLPTCENLFLFPRCFYFFFPPSFSFVFAVFSLLLLSTLFFLFLFLSYFVLLLQIYITRLLVTVFLDPFSSCLFCLFIQLFFFLSCTYFSLTVFNVNTISNM